MLDDTSRAWLAAIERGDTAEEQRLEAVLNAATLLERARRNRPGRIREAALEYAAAGLAVIPLHSARNNLCTCGRSTCASPAKHPLTPNGLLDATPDPTVVGQWWTTWPHANVGLRTGLAFDVIDIDGPTGIVNMYGGPTPMVDDFDVIGLATTGRDGRQHIYVPPTGRRSGAALVPEVDFRGDGGYVVAPPSISVTGRRYEWLTPLNGVLTGAAA